MLVRIILEVLKLDYHKIIIITGKYDELIKSTINNYFKEHNINIIIHYVQQKIPMGTADAIKYTLEYYTDNEYVLILNGDMPLISYKLLNNFLKYKEKENKIIVAKLDNPYGYGRILYNEDNIFIGINEEKDCTLEEKNINIVNVGIYYFNSSMLKKVIPVIDNNNKQNEYYLTDIIKVIKNNIEYNENIYTYCIENNLNYQIMGVNTQEELQNLENIIT
jgi:bifunctional N-acetylglucosamine-1-phosphate-uridyltransferase/glucosamine-1-phosphate-acetyltransferase GlmU-like protein